MSNRAIQLSIQYIHAGDLDGAEKTLQTMLHQNARHAQGWFLLGLVSHMRGQAEEAIAHYHEATCIDPRYPDAYNNMGWAYNQLRKPEEAIGCLRAALRLRDNFPEAYNNLGNAYLLLKKNDEALAAFRDAIRLRSDFPEALNNAAMVLIQSRQPDEALALLERAIQAKPQYSDARVNQSWAYLEKGDLDRCMSTARQALELNPNQPAAHNNLGNALLSRDRTEEAIQHFQTAIRLRVDFSPAVESLGLALLRLRRFDEAVACLVKAAQMEPARAGIFNNLAFAFTQQGRWTEAIEAASAAVQQQPEFAEAYNNLGLSYMNLQRPDEALVALEEAVRLKPTFAEALSNLGWSLIEVGQLERAVQVLQEALDIRPDLPDALNNLGLAYSQLKKPEQARGSYESALRLRPNFPEALGGMGDVCGGLGLHNEALAYYRRSVRLNPHQGATYSNMLFTLHFPPGLTPEDIFREHLGWARHNASPPAPLRSHPNNPDPERRLRVGYLSADFYRHVMGWYIEMVLESHDRQQFELFCYSNVGKPDDATRRIESLADHWRNIVRVPDAEVEEMIRRDQIDLLLDLNGHTGGNRLSIFTRKPAPVQASHFGYMDTSGLPTIDYRITDAVCDPPGMTEKYHTEQLVRLPEILWCYRPNLTLEVNELPATSAGYVTFGSLNALTKLSAPAIATWATILKRLPDSRLLVLAGISPQADQRIRDAFAGHGIASERVTLVGKRPRPDYFRLFHQVDLSFDAFPCTGCNTTCDSLWMGVPVVMLAGQTCMSRMGASPLVHLGLPDLVNQTVEDYVATAVRLAEDLPRLTELRATLRERMNRSTLMNPERFTHQLEDVYRWMWRQWCARSSKA